MIMTIKTTLHPAVAAFTAAFFVLTSNLLATPVAGTWTNAFAQGDGPILNADTASPTVGDGTANSADGEMFHSPFSAITLANSGDKIIFSGSVTLIGTINSAATSGTPRTQFRFGIFRDDGDGDELEWIGYSMSNKHGNAGTPAGTLARKPVGNTSAYLSSTGQNSLATVQGDGTAASLFNDDTYSMNMTIERSGANLIVSALLTGVNGFNQSMNATDLTASTLGTYTFDRLGFLLGGNLDTDQAVFSNLDVTFVPVPEPSALAIGFAGMLGCLLCRRSVART